MRSAVAPALPWLKPRISSDLQPWVDPALYKIMITMVIRLVLITVANNMVFMLLSKYVSFLLGFELTSAYELTNAFELTNWI